MHGNNLKFNLYRYDNLEDDLGGGANVTGTLLASSVEGRMEETKPSLVLMQQGFSTTSVFRGQSRVCPMRELDYVEVIFPEDHPYYKQWFVVSGVQNPSTHPRDGRGMLLFYAFRKDYARNVQS